MRFAINPDLRANQNSRKRDRRKKNPKKYREVEKNRRDSNIELSRVKSRKFLAGYRKYFRARLAELKAGPCSDCGQCFPPCAMDFDHRPGEVKLFKISSALSRPENVLMAEVSKCDLVCANCHRIRTFITRRTNKTVIPHIT